MYQSPINITNEVSKRMIEALENEIVLKAKVELKVDIDKDELLRALKYDRGQYNLGYDDGKKDSEQKWISVLERLPETMDDVLCWYEYFRFGEYQRMFQKFGVGFCVNGMWGGEPGEGYKARVLYWMPLPQAPKTEENT